MGRTRVLCTVSEEPGVPRWLEGAGRGWITAEYSMLPGATHPRGEREASRGRVSGRTQEIQRLIGRSLRAVVDGHPVVDLAYTEDSRAQVDMNLVATRSGRLVEVQATGEQATFTTDELEAMKQLALRGIARLCELQREAVAAGEPA